MLGGHSPDDHGIRLASNPPQLLQILQVDQMLRPSQSELHHRNQAVSAGDNPRVFAVLRQKPERLVERAGPMIGERRRYHSRSPPRWPCSFFLVYPAGVSNAAEPNGKNRSQATRLERFCRVRSNLKTARPQFFGG